MSISTESSIKIHDQIKLLEERIKSISEEDVRKSLENDLERLKKMLSDSESIYQI